MRSDIALKKFNGVYVPTKKGNEDNTQYALAFNANLMRLGYTMNEELIGIVGTLPLEIIEKISNNTINTIKQVLGDDVDYYPMYPNFPKQVQDASYFELYVNAVFHYLTEGAWRPDYEKLPREFKFEHTEFKILKPVREKDIKDYFPNIISTKDSLSEADQLLLTWYLDTYTTLDYPDVIPHKETMTFVAHSLWDKNEDISHLMKTTTDVLRFVTKLSGGDVSLSENTRFVSLPRKDRRRIIRLLEPVITEEDVKRHKNKWSKLFHMLHVCEYSKKICAIATKVRENKTLTSFNSTVESAIKAGTYLKASKLLKERPGDFARRLDHLLRNTAPKTQITIVGYFIEGLDRISTRVLLQLLGHFKTRKEQDNRIVFPKGQVQKSIIIPSINGNIDDEVIIQLRRGIENELSQRFKKQSKLGKIWIDERLQKCPLPTQQRSSSNATDVVARGTRLPLSVDKDTLRFFIYWIGSDIDLSVTFHDEDLQMLSHVSWQKLRDKNLEAYHSGDITHAPSPQGAAEFVDVSIPTSIEKGVRYVVMNVLVYSGPSFKNLEKCYAGWMGRKHPESNEIFEPGTVENKLDLTSDSKGCIPVIFDLHTLEVIWCDLSFAGNSTDTSRWGMSGNDVQQNAAKIGDVVYSILNMHNKFNLYDLFKLHGESRGEIVLNKEDADRVYSLNRKDSDVTPSDINVINSSYLV